MDCELDLAEGGPITCPTLALWSAMGPLAAWYDPLEIWRAWCTDVRGRPVAAGHFLPEEAPDEVTLELVRFLSGTPHAAAGASPTL
ncbi:hypothetical protein [Actinocrispum sp. NPDC049592]|uniref:alpha/beta fold hydrolase n=1 Tax=Actinocrispum sp. NPDC049592 TaxID=3154835 RepID=UPI003447A760